jgi:hypothetical protein
MGRGGARLWLRRGQKLKKKIQGGVQNLNIFFNINLFFISEYIYKYRGVLQKKKISGQGISWPLAICCLRP